MPMKRPLVSLAIFATAFSLPFGIRWGAARSAKTPETRGKAYANPPAAPQKHLPKAPDDYADLWSLLQEPTDASAILLSAQQISEKLSPDWPDPGEKLFGKIRSMPPSKLKAKLLTWVSVNLPVEKLSKLLAQWNPNDPQGLEAVLESNLIKLAELPGEAFKHLNQNRPLQEALSRSLANGIEKDPSGSHTKAFLQKFLLLSNFGGIALLDPRLVKSISSNPAYLRETMEALSATKGVAEIPPRARDAFANAVLASPGLESPSSADSFLKRHRETLKLSDDLKTGVISVDEAVVAAGSASYGTQMAEESLWRLATRDPETAIQYAMASKDSEFSEYLALRLWTDWHRKDAERARRFASENGKDAFLQKGTHRK